MLIQFNRTRLLGFQGKIIVPGINELSADFVAAMQEDSVLSAKFDDGELEIIDRKAIGATKVKTKKGEEPSAVDVLLAANEKEAKKLAGKTIDIAILKAWAKREKRAIVKKAVKDQIGKIEKIEYREKSENGSASEEDEA